MKDDKLLHFKTAITLVLKDLRGQKKVTQANVNADFLDQYGFAHNMGRNELEANFTIETLYMYCKYFGVSELEFFKKVNDVEEKKILEYIEEKAEKRKLKDKKQ